MANGYRTTDFVKGGVANAVAASQTKQAVSSTFIVTGEDSKILLAKVKASGVTVTNAITAILQSSWDGGTTWVDNETVSITADGTFNLFHFVAADTQPLWALGRVAVTTGVDDVATIDNVWVTRRI